MITSIHRIGAVLAIGLGLAMAAPISASAQDAAGLRSVEGSHIETQGRGRVGVRHGGRHFHGGKRRHSGRAIAGGIAAGIAGAIILNEVARSRPAYAGDGLSCRQLSYRCDQGKDWACRRLDRSC